jgi:chemotaxis signal transduction protein
MMSATMSLAVQPTSAVHSPLLVVTFDLGSQQYGLPVAAVREVVRLPDLIVMAGAPEALCGLLNLRGQYLPILDGRVLVGAPAGYDLTNQIIIVGDAAGESHHGAPALGLLVDRVLMVGAYSHARHTPIVKGTAAPLLGSLIDAERGAVVLLDCAELLALAPAGAGGAPMQNLLSPASFVARS